MAAMRLARNFESGAMPPVYRSVVNRTGCAKRHVVGSPKPDAAAPRSWRSVGMTRSKSLSAIPRRPIRRSSRATPWQRQSRADCERTMNRQCKIWPRFDNFGARSADLTGLKMRRITRVASFNHLVGACEQREWEGKTERLRGLHVDDQLDLRDLLDRQVRRPLAFEDAADVDSGLTIRIGNPGSVAHQAAGGHELARLVDRGHRVADGKLSELFDPSAEERIGADHEPSWPQPDQGCKNRIEVA